MSTKQWVHDEKKERQLGTKIRWEPLPRAFPPVSPCTPAHGSGITPAARAKHKERPPGEKLKTAADQTVTPALSCFPNCSSKFHGSLYLSVTPDLASCLSYKAEGPHSDFSRDCKAYFSICATKVSTVEILYTWFLAGLGCGHVEIVGEWWRGLPFWLRKNNIGM